MTTRQIIVTSVELPLLAFHFSMLVFIVRQVIRNSSSYRQGYYILYVAVTVADLLYMSIVGGEQRSELRRVRLVCVLKSSPFISYHSYCTTNKYP